MFSKSKKQSYPFQIPSHLFYSHSGRCSTSFRLRHSRQSTVNGQQLIGFSWGGEEVQADGWLDTRCMIDGADRVMSSRRFRLRCIWDVIAMRRCVCRHGVWCWCEESRARSIIEGESWCIIIWEFRGKVSWERVFVKAKKQRFGESTTWPYLSVLKMTINRDDDWQARSAGRHLWGGQKGAE